MHICNLQGSLIGAPAELAVPSLPSIMPTSPINGTGDDGKGRGSISSSTSAMLPKQTHSSNGISSPITAQPPSSPYSSTSDGFLAHHERVRIFVNRLLATKCVDLLAEQGANSELHRTLGAWDLTMLGVGEIVGTGIFVLTGTAAANNAGPAVIISFIIAVSSYCHFQHFCLFLNDTASHMSFFSIQGTASMFAALCYSELASIIPVSGSAYTYSYATLGSLIGWTIGWDLCLEYLVHTRVSS